MTVTLQRATSARGPFTNLQTIMSAADGSFTFSGLKPSRTTWYRVVGGGGIAVVRVVVGFRVTLLVGTARVHGQRRVRLSGVVAPSYNRGRVLLQKLGPGRRWQTISRPRLHRASGSQSTYSVILSAGERGTWRAVVSSDAAHASGISLTRRIRSAAA